MYFFPSLEPVYCYMSSSNCCFLICIQISQEAGQVVWYSHLFQNFPQFIVIHIVKGFVVVNKAKLYVFLEHCCFLNDPVDVGNLISGSSPFSKSSLNIWKFTVHILFEAWLGEFWALLCKHVKWVQLCGSLNILWHCLENWPFLVLWPLLNFPNLLAYWVQQYALILCIWVHKMIASSFRIWNSSTGIPSPPLVLFIVMLPKAHLTSRSWL